MKKILMTLSAVLCCNMMLCAQGIGEQEAKERALQFLNNQTTAVKQGRRAPARKAQLKAAPLEVSGIYAFNREDGGFVIAAADKRAVPVLGYSDSGRIDWQRLPENVKAWLGDYAQAISQMGDATTDYVAQGYGEQPQGNRQAIAPLLKTQWWQEAPYSNDCPFMTMGRALTGCVATAMAQVMNYHQWPKEECQSIPAHSIPYLEGSIDLEELPSTTFDWKNMLNDYTGSYTEEQGSAVAKLMRYCGQSVKMMYGEWLSATDGAYMADALRLFFDYDLGVSYALRNQYGIDEWEQLIYGELAAGRPVPYCGRSDDGHAFVCDGYDTNGLFHINWGWAGSCDGYFSLSVLNPRGLGPQAVSEEAGYGMCQEAIIGVQPPTGQTPVADYSSKLVPFGNMALEQNTVKFEGHYDNLVTPLATFEVAMGKTEDDGKLTPLVMAEKQYEMETHRNVDIDITLTKDNLPIGTHQLRAMARCVTTDGPWHLIMHPEKTVVAEVTADGIQCALGDVPQLEIEKAYIKRGSEIALERNEVALVVHNKGREYTGELTVRVVALGDKTSQEVCEDLPPVSAMKLNAKVGGYFRVGATEEIVVATKNLGDNGKYLFLLYEGNTEVLVDTATVAYEKDYEFEFVDLEVVAYKIKYDLDEQEIAYWVKLKNVDANNNWPKYSSVPDNIIFSLYDETGEGGPAPVHLTIKKDEEKPFKSGESTIFMTTAVTFSIDEELTKVGQTKRIFEVKVKPGETVEYPIPSGISKIVATDGDSKQFFNLNGQRIEGQPAQKGVYICNGKKLILK